MDKNKFDEELNKYIMQLKELEPKAQQQGDTHVQYSTDKLKKLIEAGQIPNEIGSWYLEWIKEQNILFKEWTNFIKSHPDIPEKDRASRFFGIPKTLSYKETLTSYETMVKQVQIHNLMLANNLIDTQEQGELNNLPAQFFQTIGTDEFGISRLIADPLNNIHKMLEKFGPPTAINDDLYITQAECENSMGDTIRLEYRFRAASQEEANLQSQNFKNRLTGRQKKVYEACWALANKRQSRIVTCDLTELMMIAHPDRKDKNSFTIGQKLEFFQDLLDLSQTQLTLKKAQYPTRKKSKKSRIDQFLLPFITIHKTSDYNLAGSKKSERYPNNISYSVLHNPLYQSEKMYNVGAGIKHKTLESRPEDMQLAEYIQIRKSQSQDKNTITFTNRDELMKLANVDSIKHTGMANKRLLDKFGRLKEKGIILSYPSRVTFPFIIKIRQHFNSD